MKRLYSKGSTRKLIFKILLVRVYLKTHMRMPPAISFLIVGSIDAGASFQIEIMSLQTKKTTTSYLMYFHMVVDYVQNSHQYSIIVDKNY